MKFKKRVKLELSDFLAYNYAITKKQMVITLVGLVISVPFLCVYLFRNSNSPLLIYITALVSSFLFSGFLILLSRRTSQKHYDSNKLIQEGFDYTIEDTGIHQSSKHGETSIIWQDVYKASESKTGIYIFIAKLQAFVIPKRLLTSQEEETLRTIIKTNLDSEKNKLKKF